MKKTLPDWPLFDLEQLDAESERAIVSDKSIDQVIEETKIAIRRAYGTSDRRIAVNLK